jgi:hypothetical protein
LFIYSSILLSLCLFNLSYSLWKILTCFFRSLSNMFNLFRIFSFSFAFSFSSSKLNYSSPCFGSGDNKGDSLECGESIYWSRNSLFKVDFIV